jgi:hypothetical protein
VEGKYDVVFASNLYQLLRLDERTKLREAVKLCLKTDGTLFISTLSINDPQHYGIGTRIDSDINSFQDEKFLHFCTQDEIERDFCFLRINELSEQEYYEHRSTGETHHHISWMLSGTLKSSND